MNWLTLGIKFYPIIVGAVHAVEAISKVNQTKGKDKQDAAVEAVSAMVQAVEIGIGKEIIDIPDFQILLRKMIDDYVALQNFIATIKTKAANS